MILTLFGRIQSSLSMDFDLDPESLTLPIELAFIDKSRFAVALCEIANRAQRTNVVTRPHYRKKQAITIPIPEVIANHPYHNLISPVSPRVARVQTGAHIYMVKWMIDHIFLVSISNEYLPTSLCQDIALSSRALCEEKL